MTFDVTGLLIFLLAIVPGFIAQQSRYSLIPRSLQEKSLVEETGDYVLNSVFIHLIVLSCFRIYLLLNDPGTLASGSLAVEQKKLLEWFWQHHYLVFTYYLTSLVVGFFLGFFRGVLALHQPFRKWVAGLAPIRWILTRFGVLSFLQEEPVWYGVLRQRSKDEITFVEIRMKEDRGFYAGELKSYGILRDSERNKDFYIINAYHKNSSTEEFTRLNADGVLLNFGDVESMQVIKRNYPR